MKEVLNILIVDDEKQNVEALATICNREGYRALRANSVSAAKSIFEKNDVDVVLTDICMSGDDGFVMLDFVKRNFSEVEVLVMTAYGTIEIAVRAIKEGAYDFITKPFDRITIVSKIEKAREKRSLLQENRQLKKRLSERSGMDQLIGRSPSIIELRNKIKQVASSQTTVTIYGESGVGKDLVARAIHELSFRAHRSFVRVNCAAIPESLLESELFGHEKGAFTGATKRKQGMVEKASGGTLFLDEIGEIPLAVQSKLLVFLETKQYQRLGGVESYTADTRIIAATNRNLRQEVDAGSFRDDLYYRLQVVELRVPALRERQADIPVLMEHFLNEFRHEFSRASLHFSAAGLKAGLNYSWPGNVRELKNSIERAVLFAETDEISSWIPAVTTELKSSEGFVVPFGMKVAEVEALLVQETLRRTDGDKTKTAEILGIGKRTLYRWLDRECQNDKQILSK